MSPRLVRLRRDLLNATRARRVKRMGEGLTRLRSALPPTSQWIDELLAEHESGSTPVSELGYAGLSACFPSSLLRATRVAMVRRVPFPPVSAFGLPELEAMARMPLAGITFRDMYFVDELLPFEHIHFHELVHVIQWRALGFDDFLLTYGANVLLHGTTRSPLEALALDLEARFKRGARLPDIPEWVAREALRARESAVAAFRACGLDFSARPAEPAVDPGAAADRSTPPSATG